MLAKWRSAAAMVAAILSSMMRLVEGDPRALIVDSQEGGVSGVMLRRKAMRGGNDRELLSSRSET